MCDQEARVLEFESLLVPIHVIGGGKKNTLTLEGTVLVYYEKGRSFQKTTLIPVECVAADRSKRFVGACLIAALFSLVIPLITFAIGYGILNILHKEEGIIMNIFLFVSSLFLLVGFILFIVLLISFFIRKQIVHIVIEGPNAMDFEFWQNKQIDPLIDHFIKEINFRKTKVEESDHMIMQNCVTFVDLSRFFRFFRFLGLFWLSCIPTLILEIPILLFLVLIPVAMLLFEVIKEYESPKEYREALVSYRKKDYGQAIEFLEPFVQQHPDYIPVLTFLISLYMRTNQFEEAVDVVSRLGDENVDLRQELQNDIWISKRLYQRRIKTCLN